MKEKIFKMLESSEPEMVRMGMILAIRQGVNWCRENIPSFGPSFVDHMLYTPCRDIAVTDGVVAIRIGTTGTIDARLFGGFRTIGSFTKI